jgi:TolA-binding protein
MNTMDALRTQLAEAQDELKELKFSLDDCDLHAFSRQRRTQNTLKKKQRQLTAARKQLADLQREVERLDKLIIALGTESTSLKAENERLREAAIWEVEQRACIHTSVRSGFGVGCSRCHAAATLPGLGWHSMIDEVDPRTALATQPEGKEPEEKEKTDDDPA